MRRVVFPVMLILALVVASFFLTFVSADDGFNTTNLVTHPAGGGEEYQSKQYQFYHNHNTVDITLNNTFHYLKAIQACVGSVQAHVYYGNNQQFPSGPNGFNLDPPLCAPNEDTFTWGQWNGMTFQHGSNGGVRVQTLFYAGTNGCCFPMGWDVDYYNDVTIGEFCVDNCY